MGHRIAKQGLPSPPTISARGLPPHRPAPKVLESKEEAAKGGLFEEAWLL